MNQWSQKSIDLAKTSNYLDRLQFIYPNEESERDIPKSILDSISKSFIEKDEYLLLTQLLNLDKFPYKDSYVSFLRKDRSAIRRNPDTVKRIIDNLYKMGLDGILEGVQEPKESNQRRGTQFRTWSFKHFDTANLTDFKRSKKGIVLLNSSEAQAKDFCSSELRVNFEKNPDLVAKVNEQYIVGEAKFSSDSGGNQDRAFTDGITLATNTSGKAYKVFLLDGVVWLSSSGKAITAIRHSTAAIFSAILLKDYLESLA